MRRLHLLDELDAARIAAPSAAHVEIQELDAGDDVRTSLFQHPDSEVRFALPRGHRGGRLVTAAGIRRAAWLHLRAPVRFAVAVETRGARRELLARALHPGEDESHRAWVAIEAPIPPDADALVLSTTASPPDHAWSGWSDPVVELEIPAAPARPRRPLAHVVLITADALRADLVNGERTKTPNLDALARDGLRFAHARAASVSTPGSHATILTGRHAPAHRIVSEWGTLPAHLPGLPTELARAGRRTILAAGERELAGPGQGFARVFAEVLPCLANPAQEGAITARRLCRRLEEAGEPVFAWLELFDTHPPHLLPAELVARHYDGDPRDPARADRPELLGRIRAVETLLHLEEAWPGLHEGRVDRRLAVRLRDTAAALAGHIEDGPDLATHLAGWDAAARGGRTVPELAAWLAPRAEALGRGEVDPELVAWLAELRPRLAELERRILSWLDGVVDVRYPLAQVSASAEYVDAQVGRVLDTLRELGAYDESLVVFTSPHGECYGEGGAFFHHHTLLESVLRVPLVVKPPRSAGIAPGVVEGVMEHLDLMPTLLDLLGTGPPRCEGRSRLAELRAGRLRDDRPALAVGVDGNQACLARPPHKLVLTLGDQPDEDGTWLRAGLRRWLDLDTDAPCDPPPDAAELEARLARWGAQLLADGR